MSSIVGTLSAENGIISSTLTDSDLLNPTRSGSYSDDYELTDTTIGQLVTIELNSYEFDTYLQLINADTGEVITENDDYGGSLNSRLSFIAVEGINYIVRVSGYDESELGTYELNASIQGPPEIVGNLSAVNGTITEALTLEDTLNPTRSGAYSDDYELTDITIGQLVTIELNSYEFDTYLQLINADTGEVITQNDDGGQGTNSKLSFVAIEGINYTVRVSGYNESQLGTYQLNATSAELANLTITETNAPSTITLGESVEVSWTVANSGNGETINDFRYDAIYLSRDTTYNPDEDASLIAVYRNNSLAAGNSQTFSTNIAIGGYHLNWANGTNNDRNLLEGDWYLLFVTDAYDNQLESDETNNVTAVEIQLNATDLAITNVVAPTSASVHDTISITWTVENLGDISAFGYWGDEIYLSDDEYFDYNDDVYLGYGEREDYTVPLALGDSYTLSREVALPNTEPGSRYLLFVVDTYNDLGETDETNNVIAVPIEISGVDTNLSIKATAPTTAALGESIAVSWTVTNSGSQAASANWSDYVYLSDDEYLDNSDTYITYQYAASNTPLAPGDSYTVNHNISIPNTTEAGSRYLLFVADYYNAQNETDETDNVTAVPIEIKAPNLKVTEAIVPEQAYTGSRISISWTVKNSGEGTALANYWYDQVYLSRDENYDSSDTYLTYYYTGSQTPLAAGDSYTAYRSITLPNADLGNYYLLFYTDHSQYQGETDETDNIRAVPIEITDPPNLIVSAATAPIQANPGYSVAVSWTVTNTGKVSANSNWYDKIYFSRDGTYDSSDTFIAYHYINSFTPLAASNSYTINRNIYLPNVELGNYYLLFVADENNYQVETDETDNVRAVPIELVASDADLTVTAATTPESAGIGETVTLSWTVTNNGSGAAFANFWQDRIYISDDEYLDSSDTYITYQSNSFNAPLAAGGSYTVNRNISIPNTKAGDRYLLFVVDGDEKQTETDEINNVYAVPIYIKAPNLEVESISVPTRINPGQTVQATWRVRNTGEVIAYNSWYDYVYLSEDETYDSSDLSLGYNRRIYGLNAGSSYYNYPNLTIPSNKEAGNYYLLFITDKNNHKEETDETDNIRAVSIEITESPNLVVSAATAPSEATIHKPFEVSWTVTNIGQGDALVRYTRDTIYVSDDQYLDSSDTYVTERTYSYYNLAAGSEYSQTHNIAIPNTGAGFRYLLFVADGRKEQLETDETDNVRAVPIEIGIPDVDLAVTATDLPLQANTGSNLAVSWTVTNSGTEATRTRWRDRVYFSEDANFDSSDIYLTDYDTTYYLGSLAAGNSHKISSIVNLPNRETGNYYLLFITDYQNIQAETNETNNITAVPLELIDLPNLTVSNITAPREASLRESINISWTVNNIGDVTAFGRWLDYVYLSTDENFDGNDIALGGQWTDGNKPLAPGDSYTLNRSLTLPDTARGDLYLLLVADRDNQQKETNEADNVTAVPIKVKAPNLVVSQVNAPLTAISSESISTTITVINIGDGSVISNSNYSNYSNYWYDAVYISDDENYNTGDRRIGDAYRHTNLAPNQSYTAGINVRIPNDVTGSKYLIFKVDAYGNRNESNETDNYYAVPIEIGTPNLTVSNATAPNWAAIGQTIPVSWTVTNNGEVSTVAGYDYYYDSVYISSDTELDNTDTHVLSRNVNREHSLAAGNSYTIFQNITLPNSREGELYLLFRTDSYNRQGETDETDNVLAIPIIISNNGPNLEVTDATAPATAVLGQRGISVNWTVTNTGGVAASLDWFDKVYLSDNPTLEYTDTELTEQATGSQTPLAAGANYNITATINLPFHGAGSRYLLFVADAESDQVETDETDNVTAVPIELLAPNLTLTTPIAPATAYLGQSVELSWTVANIGNVAALANWMEYVYISDDEILGSNDVYLTSRYRSSSLAAGNDYTISQNVTIPRTEIGDRYLLFVVDRNNHQGETNETDNLVAVPLHLTALDVDLEIGNITAPRESFAGEEVEVVWTVTNNGSDDATGSWIDRIYLSTDTETLTANELYGSFAFTGTIAAGQSLERRQKITLPRTLEGNFHIVVKTDANNSLIEYGKEDNNTTVKDERLTSILPTFSNLQVISVTAPDTAFSSQETVVEWTVSNTGTGATSASVWYDTVWLSLDTNLDGTDIYLGEAANVSYLNPGDSYNNSLAVTLPQGIDGNYYFLVKTDYNRNSYYNDRVFEFDNEGDNLGVSNISDIELTPPPDLQVSVNAPSNAFSGQFTSLTWTVTNQGEGRTLQNRWYDEVYLSADTVLDSSDYNLGRQYHSGSLEPGESYIFTDAIRSFKLPEGISGDYYFLVRTDAGNQVYEGALSANNTGYDTIPTTIFLTPPPDLEIRVDAPNTALASHEITLNYRLGNYGSTATTTGTWTETFYLSLDEQLDSSDLVLGSRRHYGILGTDDYRDKSISLTLPNGISGEYYLFAKTDTSDEVFELDNDNNIAYDTITIASQPADLVVSEVIAPETLEAGTGTRISWTVINQGTGDTAITNWNDRLWLSLDSIIGNGDDRLLETFSHSGLLNAGESYTKTELVPIPFDLLDNYQLYLQTDTNNRVYEAESEGNNSSVLLPLRITRETPDLQITAVTAPLTGVSGETLTVNWSVANLGTGKTNSNYWYDEVFLSLDRDLGDSSDISLGKVYHSGSLAPHESYNASRTFHLPQNYLEGNYYLIVRTDTGDLVLETPFENNNQAVTSSTTSISLNSVPDLAIEAIDAPEDAISGQTFALNWKVVNRGTEVNSSWRDVFYLSRDQTLDRNNDLYLGSRFHYGGLAAGAESSQTASFNLPRGLSGRFYVFGITDSGDSVYEREGENNNIAYDGNSMNVILPPPADLAAEAISVPTEGVPGQNVTINYTVTNQGSYTIDGNWEDAIYLSADDQWDINDPLIEKVRVYDSLDSGESYSRTVNASLPGVASGDYHVIVRSDIRNNVYESEEDNNSEVSAETINIDTELLELGSSDTDTIRPGKSIYYRIEASAGQAIRIKLDSQVNSSSNEIYVRYGQMPTRGQFDFFTEPFTSDPELVFPVEQDGTYYVLVSGDNGSVATNYTITAEEIPFSLLNVNTQQVGNVAPFTLELKGAKFSTDTIFQIVNSEGTVFDATQIILKDSTTAYATFNLSGQSVGNYDVRAIQNNETTEVLEDILVVEDGIDAELFSVIDGPGAVRLGGKYFAKINYTNVGGADEAAPLIILQSDNTPLGLSSNSIAPTESLFLLGVGEDVGVDTLRPGEINQIPFFFSVPYESINVNLLRYTENSSTPITEADWNLIETAIKPSEISEDDWNEFWSSIQPRIGNIWGDYVQLVNDLAKAFASKAECDYDVRELFAEWYESGDLSVYTPKSAVSGRLVDRNTGEPLSEVELQLYQEVDEETIQNFHQVVTDSEGRFTVSTLPPGNYKLAILGDYSFVDSSPSDSNNLLNNNIYELNITSGNDITDLELETDLLSVPPSPLEQLVDGKEFYIEFINNLVNTVEELGIQSSEETNIALNNLEEESQSQNENEEEPPLPKLRFYYQSPTFGIPFLFPNTQISIALGTDGLSNINFDNELVTKGIVAGSLKVTHGEDIYGGLVKGSLTSVKEKENCQWQPKETSIELGAGYIGGESKDITGYLDPFFGTIVKGIEFILGVEFPITATYTTGIAGKATFDYQTPKLEGGIVVSEEIEISGGVQKGDYFSQISGKAVVELDLVTFPETQLKLGTVSLSIQFLTKLPIVGFVGFEITGSSETGFTLIPILEPPLLPPSFQDSSSLPPGTEEISNQIAAIFNNLENDPDLKQGTFLELLQSPEKFFDFPEPPPIEDCDEEHDDYSPSVLVSRDPNDILGPQGFGEQQWLSANSPLNYTIRFENDPQLATAPAQVVKITQKLDSDLDFRTFRLGDFGFGDTFIEVPDNRAFYQTRLDLVAEKGIYLDVFAGIDIATGEAFWEFRSIDPTTGEQPSDPLLGFLPPNLTKPEGDGFVSYSIRLLDDIATGDVIDAEATIIFDINEPIDTPAIFNTIDAGKPTSTVATLPQVSDSAEFTVRWSGNDDANGSAIANYTIYVAENGGEFTPWLENTTLTQATFTGTPGSSYQFYAIARDNVGNVQDLPTSAQAVTTIAGGNNPPVLLNSIGTQIVAEDSNFSLTLSEEIFQDNDEGEILTYTAINADGSALPSWLSFDTETRTFSGTPTNEDVGNLNIVVTVTDKEGETVSDTFELIVENVNDKPTLESAIANQIATEDEAFSFTFPEDTFNDIDAGDSLTYAATLSDGSELPSWLIFDAQTRTFSGTPSNDDVGNISITVTAIDNDGEIASDIFELIVENVNDAPTLENAIANQVATEDELFNFTFPENTFNDVDAGDSLSYTATLSDGSALPSWLTFNPETRTFSGTPVNEHVGQIAIEITATDNDGEVAQDIFEIEVINVNDIPLDIELSNISLDENSSNGTIIGILSTLDPDAGDTHSYTLLNNADGRFVLDGNKLLVASGNLLDFEANSTYLIEVQTTDAEGLSITKNFTISLNDINEAPVLINDSLTANSSSAKVIAISYLLSNDSDPEGTPLSLIAVGNATNSNVTLDNGNVIFTPDTGFDGTASFEYTVSDGVLSETATVTVEVGVTQNGTNKNNTFDGTLGDDLYHGLNGNDTVRGDAGDDRLFGDNGNDTLNGGLGNDTLFGNNGEDQLFGDAGDDWLFGDNGNDTLIGGTGNDTLTGGRGADRFIFNSPHEGVDTITDFSVNNDTLVFSAAGFGGDLVPGRVSSPMFNLGVAATTEFHRFIYDAGSGDLFYDSDGTGDNEQVRIARLGSGLSLGNDNLFIGY
ncbi:tandem-95 repeat protein [Pleurocapsales cyanobacterium LEGE 06147]|nr:tandem-95 repeat protein [Pleurocapsales cyanobacterium LEGE 06147]